MATLGSLELKEKAYIVVKISSKPKDCETSANQPWTTTEITKREMIVHKMWQANDIKNPTVQTSIRILKNIESSLSKFWLLSGENNRIDSGK